MNDYYKKLFTGFLLVMIDINIGNFDVLPDVIGYLLIFSGLGELYIGTEIRSLGVARIFSIWMALIAVYEIVSGTFGLIQFGALLSYVVMILGTLGELLLVVSIYHGMTLHMEMLEEDCLYQQFNNESKRYAVILGICLIASSFSLNVPKGSSGVFVIVLVLVNIVMHIRLLINLNVIKKLFESESTDIIGE